jgi:hypothetical protein
MQQVQVSAYRAAGYPAVAIQTVEEERLATALLAELPASTPVLGIAAVGGLRDARTGAVLDRAATFAAAVARAAATTDAVLLAYDQQHAVRNPGVYRALRDALPALRARGAIVILIAPAWVLPPELEHEVPVCDWDLPTRAQLRAALDVCAQAAGLPALTDDEVAPLLDAAAGLTLAEAEGVFALSLVETGGRFDRSIVERQKTRLIGQTGYMSVEAPRSTAEIGGLGALREYLAAEVVPSADDPELMVRGVLLVGVPGTGKSLAARVTAGLLQWPLVRLDLAACKGSLVGQSEQNIRAALRLADAVAPCVLWLDEIEKAVGGYRSSAQTDSGVTLGMVGALLTWMQERTSRVLVVATCNDYAALPPELTRAGRFDERFFVDLPTSAERREIAEVHLRRYGVTPDGHTARIADLSDGWTGAEIEALVRSAARRTRRQITTEVLIECARDIRPISRVRAKEIESLREWARGALRPANTPEVTVAAAPTRRLRPTTGGTV